MNYIHVDTAPAETDSSNEYKQFKSQGAMNRQDLHYTHIHMLVHTYKRMQRTHTRIQTHTSQHTHTQHNTTQHNTTQHNTHTQHTHAHIHTHNTHTHNTHTHARTPHTHRVHQSTEIIKEQVGREGGGRGVDNLLAVAGFKQIGFQSVLECSGWLSESNFTRQILPDKRSSFGKSVMSKCLVLTCAMRRVLELEEERRCTDGVYTKKTRLVNKSCSSHFADS